MQADTSRIAMEQRLAEQEAMQQRQAIEDMMFLARQRAHADARHYRCALPPSTTCKDLRPSQHWPAIE